VKIEEKKSKVGPATLFYDVLGSGPPLVLLHGLSGSTRWWRKNLAALAGQHQVFSIDLVGFGRGRGQHFSLRESAHLVRQWLDQIGLERPDVIGHSMGGFIIADMVTQYPSSIHRLVLVDALITGLAGGIFRQGLGLLDAARFMAPDFFPVLVKDALRAGPRTMLNAILAIQRANLTPALKVLDMPILIVWGENDRLLPVESGRKLAELLPQARFQVVAGAGHNPMWDRPAVFNRLVLDFLSEGER
jgi:pimeloyl-ACP methyl ester carboxylesterase